MDENAKIKVLYLEPGKLAEVREINAKLESYQGLVDGLIDYMYLDDGACLIFNDEGKISGMELNRAIYDEDKDIIDIVAGPCFICDGSGEDFASVTSSQLARYGAEFGRPEMFVRIGGKIKAVKYTP